MTGLLFVSESGSTVAFLLGFLLLPVMISIISILIKLFRFKKKKAFLLRPVLTIIMFFFLLSMVHMTFAIAVEQASQEARLIARSCNQLLFCPETPNSWQQDGSMIRKKYTGSWLSYHASYHSRPDRFAIHLYLITDTGKVVIGGINQPIEVIPYKENQAIL